MKADRLRTQRNNERKRKEREARERLNEAAPALLEALKNAVSIIEVLFEEKGDPPPSCMMDFCEMTAAIAQAEK